MGQFDWKVKYLLRVEGSSTAARIQSIVPVSRTARLRRMILEKKPVAGPNQVSRTPSRRPSLHDRIVIAVKLTWP